MNWETVIGLEVHARLLTKSKIFCGCSTAFGAPPNTQVCPVCLALPGALPVLNRAAVELALRVALATDCTIHPESTFARKNYFYPDLPKGYQISQFERPLATNGAIVIRTAAGARTIAIHRIHMEEDAGKLHHQAPAPGLPTDATFVDLNRAGTPLVEIVSEPQIHSGEEATAYLSRLRQILMFTGVCDGNMEEGSMRCDANVSVRRHGESLGTRTEIKNLNSFRFLRAAIDFEVSRQIALLEAGERVVQETRLYDPPSGETRSMRSKEEAHDYRYFPDPDLLDLRVDNGWVDAIRDGLPPLPHHRVAAYEAQGIAAVDAEALVATRELSDYFEETARLSGNWKLAANWVKNEVLGAVNESRAPIEAFPVTPARLASLLGMLESGAIGGKAAKEVFEEISRSGEEPAAVVDRKGLGQVSDPAAIRAAAEKVLAGNAATVEQYRAGKQQVFGFLVGQLMKETKGKAKADLANSILRELLDG